VLTNRRHSKREIGIQNHIVIDFPEREFVIAYKNPLLIEAGTGCVHLKPIETEGKSHNTNYTMSLPIVSFDIKSVGNGVGPSSLVTDW